jgi:hypothetical protein
MRTLKLFLLGLLTASSPLLAMADPHINGVMTANAGTRFTLGPSDQEGVLSHTVDGVAQVSVIGNCIVHFDVLARPEPPGVPWKVEGTMYFLYPNDGSILRLKVTGSVLPELDVPIGNFHYDAEVISGEGQFAGARGQGEINGAAMFIDTEGNGTATWKFQGNIFTRPSQ